jgi:hypothetical protein
MDCIPYWPILSFLTDYPHSFLFQITAEGGESR